MFLAINMHKHIAQCVTLWGWHSGMSRSHLLHLSPSPSPGQCPTLRGWGCSHLTQHRLSPPPCPATYNPQNTPQALVLPSAKFTAAEAVERQLEALQQNDTPWPGHGIQLAYEWAYDVGGLDPSWYFGYPKDLYHFDHFQVRAAFTPGELPLRLTVVSMRRP